MSKLAAALAWAARGFRVFPLLENEKDPAWGGSWVEHATSDPATIRGMWTDPVLRTEMDYNIGVDCTDMVVVDIDVKKGKDGYNQYMQLGGTFDTLVVKTPTGGYHCYFEGPDSANVNIAKDIEIRSHHGYVVAPGSIIDGVPYEVVNDVPPAWVNLEVERLLKPADIRVDKKDYEADNPASIQAGINYLQSAPVAIEGQQGDATTFQTAARLVREIGLSPETAFALMAEHWNERCVPPWQLDELRQKVENAAQYGTATLGRLDPSVTYGSVAVEPPPSLWDRSSNVEGLAWGNALAPMAIPARPWLMDRVLMTGKVSMIGAVGSAGKSSTALTIAAHVVLGLKFGPYTMHGAHKVIVYNGEDDLQEQSRRLLAVCVEYGFDYDTIKQHVMLLSKKEVNMRLVASGGRGVPRRNDAIIDGLKQIAGAEGVGLIILDPMISVHHCDENDPVGMSSVMEVLEEIAEETNTAILLAHHTTKSSGVRQEDRVGNADIFRGTSGIVNSCRAAFTLMDASQEDAAEYGLQDHERHMWVRMDDAKMNMALKGYEPLWMRKKGVKIVSGDVIGVFKIEEIVRSHMHIRLKVADVLSSVMTINGHGSMQIVQAVAVLKSEIPVFANQKDAEIRQKVEGFFIHPVLIRDKTLQIKRETHEGKPDKVILVMT